MERQNLNKSLQDLARRGLAAEQRQRELERQREAERQDEERERSGSARGVSRQAGLTLIEAGLVLLVVAIVVIGVISLFRNTNSSAQVQTENSNLQAIVAGVKEMYGTSRDYGTAAMTGALVTNRAVPQPMIVGGNLQNAWDGSVTVVGSSSTFTITYPNVPRKQCAVLAQAPIDPVAVRINGAAQPIPLTAANVVAACSAATNTIAWDVR